MGTNGMDYIKNTVKHVLGTWMSYARPNRGLITRKINFCRQYPSFLSVIS